MRKNLIRDSILYQQICVWGVTYDASRHRYALDCRTDNDTYNAIVELTRAASLDFDNACFNSFIAAARGTASESYLSWDRHLDAGDLLPGEVIVLNPGAPYELGLLKIARGKYLIIRSNNTSQLLRTLSTNGNEAFYPGKTVAFDAIGEYRVECMHILPPPRLNRAIDYSMSHIYNHATVADDISCLIPTILQPLNTNNFEQMFDNIVHAFVSKGISTWAMRVIADAHTKKSGQR